MGAESAEYTKPMIDPQWIDAWKMFVDRDGNEYGVPVKLPNRNENIGRVCSPLVSSRNEVIEPQIAEIATPARIRVVLETACPTCDTR